MLTNTKTNIFKFKCKPLHVTIWFNVGLVGLHNDCGGRRWLESSQKRFLTFASIAFAPAGRFVESPSCRNPADQQVFGNRHLGGSVHISHIFGVLLAKHSRAFLQ